MKLLLYAPSNESDHFSEEKVILLLTQKYHVGDLYFCQFSKYRPVFLLSYYLKKQLLKSFAIHWGLCFLLLGVRIQFYE